MNIDYDKWCNRCKYRSFDLNKGILCALTKNKPKIIETCNQFKADENKIKYMEFKEKEQIRREKKKNETGRTLFYDFLYEKQLLLPFFILLSIVSIYSFDRSQLESILLVLFTVIYTIRLLFSTRIARKNERYVYIEDNRVKNIAGPGIITLYSINKYIKVDLNVIAPDLINEKYDYKLKNRINKHLKSGSLYI